MMFTIGFIVGAVVIGFIANRRPEWFAKVVFVANTVDDKVNAAVTKTKV